MGASDGMKLIRINDSNIVFLKIIARSTAAHIPIATYTVKNFYVFMPVGFYLLIRKAVTWMKYEGDKRMGKLMDFISG